MKRIIIPVVILTMALVSTAASESTFSPFRHDMYALGMGDAFVAYGDNVGAFIYNPALLAQMNGFKIAIPDLQVSVNNEFYDVIDYMVDNQDKFEDWDSLSATEKNELVNGMKSFDDRWVDVAARPLAGVILPMGVGLAVYDNLLMKVKLDRGIWEPRGYADLRNDLVFIGGYARSVSPKLAVGGNIKFISRRYSGAIKLNASQFGEMDEIYEDVSDSLESAKSGFGLDVGAVYNFMPNLDFGASIIDLIGTVDGDKTPINFRIGAAYNVTGGFMTNPFFKGLTIAADLDDMFNRDGDHLFNKLHIGADLRMRFVDLRCGFNQGYPCFGVGLNLYILSLDYTYAGFELGDAPGREDNYIHYARVGIGW
jgi:hypothetical protein